MESWGTQLPIKVFEVIAEVKLVNENLQCGLLCLELSPQRFVPCFFNQPWTSPSTLLVGAKMLVNAWLVDQGGKVPYLAASVWERGSKRVTTNLLARIFWEPKEEDVNIFKQYNSGLLCQLYGVKRSSFEEDSEVKRARIELPEKNFLNCNKDETESLNCQTKCEDSRQYSQESINEDLRDQGSVNEDLRDQGSVNEDLRDQGSVNEDLTDQGIETQEFVCCVEDCDFRSKLLVKSSLPDILNHAIPAHISLRLLASDFQVVTQDKLDRSIWKCSLPGCVKGFKSPRVTKKIHNHFRSCHLKEVFKILKDTQPQFYDENLSSLIDDTEKLHKSPAIPHMIGRVLKILNANYGIGMVVWERNIVHVLFDIHDLWIEDELCASLGKTLNEVLKIGDSLKIASVEAPFIQRTKDSIWNFRLIASAVMTASSDQELARKKFHIQTVAGRDEMVPEKVQNFLTVVGYVTTSLGLSVQEQKVQEVFKKSCPWCWWGFRDLSMGERVLLGHHGIIVDSVFHETRGAAKYVLIYFLLEVLNRESGEKEKKECLAAGNFPDHVNIILPGTVVTFNAILKGGVGDQSTSPVSYHATSCRLGLSPQDRLYDTSYNEIALKDRKLWTRLRLLFNHRHQTLNFPMLLTNVPAHLIYVANDLAVVQVDLDVDTVFGLHLFSTALCPSQEGSKSKEAQQLAKSALESGSCQVRVSCVLLDPLGSLQYLVTGLSQTTPPPNIEFQEVFPSVVERFHHLLPYTTHIPQLFDEVSASNMINKIFSAADFKRFLSSLEQQLNNSKVDIDALVMNTSTGFKTSSSQVKTVIQLIGDKCSAQENVLRLNIMQMAVSSTLLSKIASTGLMSMRCLGGMSEDDVYDWLVTHLDLEDQPGLSDGWGMFEDCRLILLAVRLGFNWNRIKEDADSELKRKLLSSDGVVNELIVGRFIKICNRWIFPKLSSSFVWNINNNCE